MKYYTFSELKEYMLICFEQGLRNYENSCIKATAYCYLNYEVDLDYGLDESILVTLVIGKIMTDRTNRVFIGEYKLLEKAAKEALEKQNELDVTDEERTEIVDWAKQLLKKLPSLEIEYDPNAK